MQTIKSENEESYLPLDLQIFNITENNIRIKSDEMFILTVAYICVFRPRTIYTFLYIYIKASCINLDYRFEHWSYSHFHIPVRHFHSLKHNENCSNHLFLTFRKSTFCQQRVFMCFI